MALTMQATQIISLPGQPRLHWQDHIWHRLENLHLFLYEAPVTIAFNHEKCWHIFFRRLPRQICMRKHYYVLLGRDRVKCDRL